MWMRVQDSEEGNLELIQEVLTVHTDVIRLLLQHGADPTIEV